MNNVKKAMAFGARNDRGAAEAGIAVDVESEDYAGLNRATSSSRNRGAGRAKIVGLVVGAGHGDANFCGIG